MKKIINLLFLLLVSWNSFAEENLSIQIAATEKTPNLNYYRTITGLTSVYTDKSASGLFKVRVGSYKTRADAEYALNKLKAKGLKDAFITISSEQQMDIYKNEFNTSNSIDNSLSKNSAIIQNNIHPSSMPVWNKLTEKQKSNLVYLDGVLHLKENDQFIPLSNF